jgi:hypothetical protein
LTNTEKLNRVHVRALAEFDRIQSALRDERLQCLQDRRFYSLAGAQWEGALGEQFENKPKFEVNKVHLAVIRIINEYRNNRITVDFVPKDGTNDDKLSGACNGLFRADEHDSGAEEAYDNMFEEAVGGGFGALRLRTCYEDDEDPDDERQRIKIEPIYDADTSVFFDLDAKRQDKADAHCCFVVYSMTREAFADEYDEDPASWPKEISQHEFDWLTPNVVFVSEYYEIDDETDYAVTFTGLAGDEVKHRQSEIDADDELIEVLIATGYKETRRKKLTVKRVHKYILSGNSILDDCGYIAGKCIPIVPGYGKRWFVDNIERCMGHVRLSKDAQRLKNMQLSKLGELSALSSTQKPIFTPEQMAGHAVMWSEDNIKDYPYLLVNSITGADGNPMPAGPLAYTQPPQIPPAMAALLQLTEQDMQSILGNQGEADKMVSNISGKAVEMIQTRMDMQTFIYISNFAKAIRRVGEIWLSMAKDVYVESGRQMKTISSGDDTGKVELMRPNKDESGGITYENDLSKASFDVAVDVGPSSASRREATVRSLVGIMQVSSGDPETMQVLQSMAIMNMEGEGIQEVRDFFRQKLVKMGALKPTEEEAKAMAAVAKEKTPQDQALEAMAEEAQAKATKARTEVLETVANVELKKAQVLETEANVKLKEAQAVAALGKTDTDSMRVAIDMQEKLNGMEQRMAAAPAQQQPITVHIHNDGEKKTRIHKITRGPDGELIGAEIVKGGDDDGA